MARRALTELEYCVLAVIARNQPCTAYAVRREFQTSLTESWRASTGSIYPLMRKLVSGGEVRQVDVPGRTRNAKMLSLTAAGDRAILHWLTSVTDALAAPVADPIRTRAHLLELLSPADARAVVNRWKDATSRTLAQVEARLDEAREINHETGRITLRGSQLQVQARLQWLEELEAEFR